MKLPYNMEKRILNFTKLKSYNEANNKPYNNGNKIKKEPLSTRSAVKFLIDGTLRLRVCRYCLNMTEELSELDEILEIGIDGSIHEVTIRDMVASFHPVKISDDPNCPNKICSECLDQTMKSYLFLQHCEKAERALSNCIEDIHKKYFRLDPIEPVRKRGKRKLNPNPNIIYVEHENVIDYAEPIISLININSIPKDHAQMSDLECKKCWQVLPSIESLVNHEKSHPTTMWFHCRLCGKSFPKRHHLKRHLRDKKMESVKDMAQTVGIKCSTCGIISEHLGKHLLHIEKHKFKVMLEHVIERKMDRLCSVCLEESSNMIKLDEIIHIHGGYPGLVGDKSIYDIVSQTFPNGKFFKHAGYYYENEIRSRITLDESLVSLESIKKFQQLYCQHSKNTAVEFDRPTKCFANGKINSRLHNNVNNVRLSVVTELKHNESNAESDQPQYNKIENKEDICRICWIFEKPMCKTCRGDTNVSSFLKIPDVSRLENHNILCNDKHDWIFSKVAIISNKYK